MYSTYVLNCIHIRSSSTLLTQVYLQSKLTYGVEWDLQFNRTGFCFLAGIVCIHVSFGESLILYLYNRYVRYQIEHRLWERVSLNGCT